MNITINSVAKQLLPSAIKRYLFVNGYNPESIFIINQMTNKNILYGKPVNIDVDDTRFIDRKITSVAQMTIIETRNEFYIATHRSSPSGIHILKFAGFGYSVIKV